jgi:hypothetical protein
MSSGYKFRFVALLLFVKLTETCSIYDDFDFELGIVLL